MKQKIRRYKLKRELGLFNATLYGVGVILGAGIYALIGVGAGIAGNALWISFIIAAIISAFTALSYAELSSMYPKEAAEYVYTREAFKSSCLSFIVSWVMIIAGFVGAATVALGFGGYFSHLIGVPPILAAAVLIFLLSLLNYFGIKESARYNVIAGILEVSGLLIVALIGLYFLGFTGTNINFLEIPQEVGLVGIMSATALIFFAYIGFEDVANIAEETKNPTRTIPRALLLALTISTILYILVAVGSVSALGWEKLSQSKAPLTEVVAVAFGKDASIFMSIIALFATSNTVLVLLIFISRMLYGVSHEHSLPPQLSRIGKRGTPYISVFLVMVFSVASLALGGIKVVALLTTIGIFIAYLFVNLSLLWLRYREPKLHRPFKTPINIGKFPVLAFLGIVTCGAMLFYFEPMLLLFETIVIFIGIGIYKILNR